LQSLPKRELFHPAYAKHSILSELEVESKIYSG